MDPVLAAPRCGRAGPFVAALAVLVALTAAGVRAQTASGDGVYYTNRTAFAIPFQTEAADRRIQQVLLYVSEDYGKSYQQVASAQPQQRSFRFQARRDGWYWFGVQTVDADNRSHPASVEQAPPGLKVCVDTQPPVVVLRQTAARDTAAAVEWDVRDENLDLTTLRLDYRLPGGRDWYALPVQQLAQGQHAWNPPVHAPLEVRLQVRDRAGNPGEAAVTVTPGAARPGAAAPVAAPTPGNVLMVRTRRIHLNYKVEDEGPTGVSVIEVWYTADGGRTWTKYQELQQKTPPCVVDVAREGRYGFTLIARSGVGLGEQPPRPGDLPQVWVEVDETKPLVRLLGVEVGRGPEAGTLTIRWTASDRYLGAAPVTISYAATKEGPWTPVAANLPNDGQYVWRKGEDVPYKFYVRVEATDLAGNVGRDDSTQPVIVDLSLPKARVTAVEPAGLPMSPPSDPLPPRMN